MLREFCDRGCVLEDKSLVPFDDLEEAIAYYDASVKAGQEARQALA